jgi:hypothetical protein
MRNILFTFLLTLIVSGLSAQQPGAIEIRRSFWGTTYRQNDQKLSAAGLMEKLRENPAAFSEMKKARTNQTFSAIFSGVGGFMVGWPLGTAAGGGDANWTLAGIGAGLIVAAIPFEIAFNKRARNAINTYNSGLGKSSWRKPALNLGFTRHGMGMKLSF